MLAVHGRRERSTVAAAGLFSRQPWTARAGGGPQRASRGPLAPAVDRTALAMDRRVKRWRGPTISWTWPVESLGRIFRLYFLAVFPPTLNFLIFYFYIIDFFLTLHGVSGFLSTCNLIANYHENILNALNCVKSCVLCRNRLDILWSG